MALGGTYYCQLESIKVRAIKLNRFSVGALKTKIKEPAELNQPAQRIKDAEPEAQ